jgi:hypothetical protein
MTSQTLDTIIIALVTLLAALVPYISSYIAKKRAEKGQLYKLAYIKMVYLSRRAEGKAPIYKFFSKRLDKEIDVFDEFHFYRLNMFQTDQKDFSSYDRSSGTVDLMVIHPWQAELHFDDPGGKEVPHLVQQKLAPGRIFFTRTMFFNGFQKGNEDFMVKMEKDTHEAKLIADFSSIPNYQQIIKTTPQGKIKSGQTEQQAIGVIESGGIYILQKENLKKDDVLILKFDIDWEKVDEFSNKSKVTQSPKNKK